MNWAAGTEAARAGLAEFPELRRLVDLMAAGWILVPVTIQGEVTHIHGARTWPNNWVDVIGVRYTTDAQGVRTDPMGNAVWKREGTVEDVVLAILDLPTPGTHTMLGTPPLWTP